MTSPTIYCVIYTDPSGPSLIEFDSERDRLTWLSEQDDSHEDFYSFEVVGSIDGLTTPNVGRYALEDLKALDEGAAAAVQAQPHP
jgi:hypothetical protein